jgi:glycosyltransferase involved in cell wall biosynthesis
VETTIILGEILAQLSNPRISYFEGEFGAPGIARNFAMPLIDSEWFWFVDADDLPNTQLVLSLLHEVQPEHEVIVGSYVVTSQSSKIAPLIPSRNSDLRNVARNPGIWRMIFRSSVFHEFRFRNFRMAEDQIFLLDIDFFDRNVKYSELIFYTYFKHEYGQLTSQKSAISDLRLTIPMVASRLVATKEIQRQYVGIMLARQFASEFKSANWGERIGIFKQDFRLLKILRFRLRLGVCIELLRIVSIRLINK